MFNWQIGIPGSEIKELIDKTSFQGWEFEYRYTLSNHFTVGGNFNWSIFHQEIDKSTWNFDQVDLRSRNWRSKHVNLTYWNMRLGLSFGTQAGKNNLNLNS